MNAKGFKLLALVLFFLFLFQVFFLFHPKKPAQAALTNVRDILSNSRLSFIAAEDSGNSVGSSLVRIKLVGDSPPGWAKTVKNFNLFPGQTIKVGDKVNYAVDDIIDDTNDDLIKLTSALETGDADVDDPVIATQSARHQIELTTGGALANGAIRVRIAAASAGGNDGIPDAAGFDFKPMAAGYVTCPSGGGVTSWESATATASGGTGCASGYHCFECRYNGTLSASQSLTMYVGTTTASQQLINPAPSSTSRTIGVADRHTFIVDHLQFPAYNAVDTTTGKVAVQEAVRVTATVEPTLEFTIAGIGVGNTACGLPAGVTTTAATVPFGTLSITNFTAATQQLTVSTNADSGYQVTLIENDQLGKDGATAPYIPDSTGDAGNMNHTAKADWNDPSPSTSKGLGYSLENIDCATNCSIAFSYDQTDGLCAGTDYCGKNFPANAESEPGQIIFSSTDVASSEDVYMCYKAVISATQDAGDYENYVTFVATAKF